MTQEGTGSGQFAGKPEAGVGRSPLLSGGGTFLSPRPRTPTTGSRQECPQPRWIRKVHSRFSGDLAAAALQGSRRRGRRIQPIPGYPEAGVGKPPPCQEGGLSCPPVPGRPTTVSRQECPQPEMGPQGSPGFPATWPGGGPSGLPSSRPPDPANSRGSGGRKTPAPVRRGDFPVPPSPDIPPRFRARNARNRDGSAGFTAGFPATWPGGGPSGFPSRPPDPANSPGIRKRGYPAPGPPTRRPGRSASEG